MIYAVIDTNVIVSALLSRHINAATVLIRKHILDGMIIPLYNSEIYQEYVEVLHREKLHLPANEVDAILDAISYLGMAMERTKTDESFIDPKDVVFYEVALSKEGSYLVTGNIKHFPKTPTVVTPAELLDIIESEQN